MATLCGELEEALRTENPETNETLMAHARTCSVCSEKLRDWREISAAARGLRRSWDSPALWPGIENALIEESRKASVRPGKPAFSFLLSSRWLAAAACASLLVMSLALAWVFVRNGGAPLVHKTKPDLDFDKRILTDQALKETEAAEARYIEAIDKLSRLADPMLQKPASPLLINYRERLLLLDGAIAECRANIELNRSNAHLRRELVSIYQEKQRTLTDLMKENPNERP